MTAGTVLSPQMDFRRNWQGRPIILQPDGTERTYTRVTTLAKTLEEQSQLTAWKQRMTLLGASMRPDVVMAAANARMMPDIKEQKRELNKLAEQAMEAAQSGAKAQIGTALHGFSEHVDAGLPIAELPPMVQPIMMSYSRLVAEVHQVWGIRIVGTEVRLVCDDIEAAGTADRLWYFPNPVQVMTSFGPIEIPAGVTVVDLKTGSVEYAGLGIGVQLGTYASSERYDVATGARTPLGQFVLDGERHYVPVNLDTALVLHLPSDAMGGIVELLPVNIRGGYAAALDSFKARETRKASKGWIGTAIQLTAASPVTEPAADVSTDTYADAHSCMHGSTHGPCRTCFPPLTDQQPSTPAERAVEQQLVEHDVDEHNATVSDITWATDRGVLERLWDSRARHLETCEPTMVHYRLRWGELAPAASNEAVARRVGHADPLHCTCDPRERTGWTHDPELDVHVCSTCRRPSRENARRLAAGQPATRVMTHPVSVPAGRGAVANVPDRVQPEPIPPAGTGHVVRPEPIPPEVQRCEHGLPLDVVPPECGPCAVSAAADPAELAHLWTGRPELRAHSALFGARGRELNEEWTRLIADGTAEWIADHWNRFACVPELEELGRAKWSLSNGGVEGQAIAVS